MDKFDKRMMISQIAIPLTRKYIEYNNLPKFQAIDYLHYKERALSSMPINELKRLYKSEGKPTNVLIWEGWNYQG